MKVIYFVLISLISAHASSIEFRLSAGYQSHDADWLTDNSAFDNQDFSDNGYHLGFSVKNIIGKNKSHAIGVGVDFDSILDEELIGYRAIDYQYILNKKIRFGGFIGGASLDTGLPQNGYYAGVNGSYYLNDSLSLTFEVRHGNGLGRDRLLPNDPESEINRPDIFLDFNAYGIQVDWNF